jgi:hypothetical protein
MGGFQVIDYDIPRRTVAAYYPECKALIPLWQFAQESKTPAAKSVPIRIDPEYQTTMAEDMVLPNVTEEILDALKAEALPLLLLLALGCLRASSSAGCSPRLRLPSRKSCRSPRSRFLLAW